MLATFAFSAALIVGQGPTQAAQTETSPAKTLISKMLAYYFSANTLTGNIVLTAAAGGGHTTWNTTVQFERPSKLYIQQARVNGPSEAWYITSDGKVFSYAAPENTLGSQPGTGLVSGTPGLKRNRLFESVVQGTTTYDVRMIYAVGATDSLADRSIPLDIAIGRRADLAHDVLCWDKPAITGKATVNGMEVSAVTGDYKRYGNAPVSGKFELDIADDGRLLRYTTNELVGDKNSSMQLTQVWDVNLTVNGKPDSNLFKVVH